jgi:hypothetical protein
MKKRKMLLQQLKRQELDDNSQLLLCSMVTEAQFTGRKDGLDDIHGSA